MVRLRILNKYQWNNDQIIDQNQITGIVTYKGHVVQDPNQKVAIKEFSKEELGETRPAALIYVFTDLCNSRVSNGFRRKPDLVFHFMFITNFYETKVPLYRPF